MVAGLPEFDTTCAIQCQSYIVKVSKIDNVTCRFLIPKQRSEKKKSSEIGQNFKIMIKLADMPK